MKRFISAFLAILMLVSVMMVVSCAPQEEPENTVSTDLEGELTLADLLGFDKQDNAQKEFTIMNNGRFDFTERDFYVADSTADNLSKAIYERNVACEEYLGITLNVDKSPNAKDNTNSDQINKQVMAGGTCTYDMVSAGHGQFLFVPIGTWTNILQMDYINLDHEWWVKGTLDHLAINNQLYLIVGDACPSMYSYVGTTFVNLAVAEEYQINVDFYDLVKSGDWTLDEFFRLFKLVGEGKDTIDINTDTVGWLNHGISGRFLFTSAGLEMIQRQADGTFALRKTLDSRITDYVAKMYNAFEDPHSEYIGADDTMIKCFTDDRALFVTTYLGQAEKFRSNNMDSPFAILPMPKYDDNQTDYIASNAGAFDALAFPRTVASADLCGQVAEFMSYYGKEYVIPEYYDVKLKYKDNDVAKNIEMLDLIREKLIITPNESYGSIKPAGEGQNEMMYYTQLTYYTTGKKGNGDVAFYANPISLWERKYSTAATTIKNYVLTYYTGG